MHTRQRLCVIKSLGVNYNQQSLFTGAVNRPNMQLRLHCNSNPSGLWTEFQTGFLKCRGLGGRVDVRVAEFERLWWGVGIFVNAFQLVHENVKLCLHTCKVTLGLQDEA
jgi:hypothetical protein